MLTPEQTSFNNTQWKAGIWRRKPESVTYGIGSGTVFHCYPNKAAVVLCHRASDRLTQGQTECWLAEARTCVCRNRQVGRPLAYGVRELRILHPVQRPNYREFDKRLRNAGISILFYDVLSMFFAFEWRVVSFLYRGDSYALYPQYGGWCSVVGPVGDHEHGTLAMVETGRTVQGFVDRLIKTMESI